MSGSKERSWKVLGVGRDDRVAQKVEKHLHELNYKNAKVVGLENNKTSDDKFIELLKSQQWDGVSIGGGINGFDLDGPKEVETLHWFERVVNLVREHAPTAKLIFVSGPHDLADSFERVLGAAETVRE